MGHIAYEVRERIAYLTLDREEKRNALSPDMMTQCCEYFGTIAADNAIRAVILRSAGRVFSAGADLDALKTMQEQSLEQNIKDSQVWQDFFLTVYHFPKIVIAQVQGPAIAGGCGLVALCDFVLASSRAVFGCPEVSIGFVPAIIMFFLMQKVGVNWAKEMVLSGERLTAQRAHTIGLVNRVVAPDALATETEHFARTLLRRNSVRAMQLTKRIWQKLQDTSLKDGIAYATHINATARSTAACKRGVTNFLQKGRDVNWMDVEDND